MGIKECGQLCTLRCPPQKVNNLHLHSSTPHYLFPCILAQCEHCKPNREEVLGHHSVLAVAEQSCRRESSLVSGQRPPALESGAALSSSVPSLITDRSPSLSFLLRKSPTVWSYGLFVRLRKGTRSPVIKSRLIPWPTVFLL